MNDTGASIRSMIILRMKGSCVQGIQFGTSIALDEWAWQIRFIPENIPRTVRSMLQNYQKSEDYDVHAGHGSAYKSYGWVANDVHSESASRTFNFAYNDYAAYTLARELNISTETMSFLLERALVSSFTLFNNETGFMEARNKDGGTRCEEGWNIGVCEVFG
ncbi:hypothetical protein BJ165DRAFT_329256 [Panaeolus papilionaceus]|nr:hypothetical protein BJ165DRAFT_329256 [Panaeolus papilionaceus]